MTLTADVFPKLPTLKDVVKLLSKNSPFRRHFGKQDGKGDQTLLKSEPHQFIDHCEGNSVGKIFS